MRKVTMTALALMLSGVLPVGAQSAAPAQQPPASPPPPPAPAVKVGETAPDFSLPYLAAKAEGGFERRQLSLADYRGRQNVVLAFFPAAFSPG
jgi:ABC-type nitrate/sulfonate/bicarbonate transport system substrate-binding protein